MPRAACCGGQLEAQFAGSGAAVATCLVQHVACGAGQAVVQFARNVLDQREYALKVFAVNHAFEAEAAMYKDETISSFLPRVEAMHDGTDTAGTDPQGRPLCDGKRSVGLARWAEGSAMVECGGSLAAGGDVGGCSSCRSWMDRRRFTKPICSGSARAVLLSRASPVARDNICVNHARIACRCWMLGGIQGYWSCRIPFCGTVKTGAEPSTHASPTRTARGTLAFPRS